jgi:hypothetical protein
MYSFLTGNLDDFMQKLNLKKVRPLFGTFFDKYGKNRPLILAAPPNVSATSVLSGRNVGPLATIILCTL